MRALEASPVVLVTHPDPYRLAAMLQREKARRAMVPRGAVTEVAPGLWGCWVVQLKPYRPAWVVPARVAAGTVGALVLAGIAGWFLLSAITAVFTTMLGIAAVVVAVRIAVRPRGCETTVIIRHRH